MQPYNRAPSPRLVRRPSAVSTSLLSTPALDVDLHLVLTRRLADVFIATTFVRLSFQKERIAVDLFVAERRVASGADASALAAAEALVLRRTPAACREFVRQAIAAAMALCPN
ncbi:MAG: hypothetical protein ACREKH_14675 [Candidatus Rokuibacteriota bacterium]